MAKSPAEQPIRNIRPNMERKEKRKKKKVRLKQMMGRKLKS